MGTRTPAATLLLAVAPRLPSSPDVDEGELKREKNGVGDNHRRMSG